MVSTDESHVDHGSSIDLDHWDSGTVWRPNCICPSLNTHGTPHSLLPGPALAPCACMSCDPRSRGRAAQQRPRPAETEEAPDRRDVYVQAMLDYRSTPPASAPGDFSPVRVNLQRALYCFVQMGMADFVNYSSAPGSALAQPFFSSSPS